MKKIFKYTLAIDNNCEIKMPKFAEVLTVQTQGGNACIWAIVNTHEEVMESRHFEIFGTGHEMPEDIGVLRKYIGTFQINGGALVFHVFERE